MNISGGSTNSGRQVASLRATISSPLAALTKHLIGK
jgi:hypothetical protein